MPNYSDQLLTVAALLLANIGHHIAWYYNQSHHRGFTLADEYECGAKLRFKSRCVRDPSLGRGIGLTYPLF